MVLFGFPLFARASDQTRYEVLAVRAWSLTDVGQGGRSLFITYAQGSSSCSKPATSTVIETNSTITVRLQQRIALLSPGEGLHI